MDDINIQELFNLVNGTTKAIYVRGLLDGYNDIVDIISEHPTSSPEELIELCHAYIASITSNADEENK